MKYIQDRKHNPKKEERHYLYLAGSGTGSGSGSGSGCECDTPVLSALLYSCDDSGFYFNWSAVPNAVQYEIERSIDSDNFLDCPAGTTLGITWFDSIDSEEGYTVQYRVQANCDEDCLSEWGYSTIDEIPSCGSGSGSGSGLLQLWPPEIFDCWQLNQNQIVIDWDDVPQADHFHIGYKSSYDNVWDETDTQTSISHTFTGDSGYTYTFRVKSKGDYVIHSDSEWSTECSTYMDPYFGSGCGSG